MGGVPRDPHEIAEPDSALLNSERGEVLLRGVYTYI